LQIENTPKQAKKSPSGPQRGSTGGSRTRWLIAREGNGPLDPLCVQVGWARVLPVFSFEEEAEMFLHLGDYDDGVWWTRESCAGELVSVLCGPCVGAKGVALDPLPEMPEDGTIGLVWVGRKRFLEQLLASKGEWRAS